MAPLIFGSIAFLHNYTDSTAAAASDGDEPGDPSGASRNDFRVRHVHRHVYAAVRAQHLCGPERLAEASRRDLLVACAVYCALHPRVVRDRVHSRIEPGDSASVVLSRGKCNGRVLL